jgi:menaquinone-dependent protoporphyrinogen oxidase
MENHILIAYASKYGSTKEVAEYIGQVLQEAGGKVEVRNVNDIKDISAYQSVIVGSATRMDKLLPDAVKFANKHARALSEKTTAYFVLCVTMKQDTQENRSKAQGFLEPLCQIREPISIGLFAGKIDYNQLGFFWKTLASKDETGMMEEGDFRNWEQIQTWASEIAPSLLN